MNRREAERQNKRLLNVAKATREAKPAEFHMEHYAHRCGAPACALGHYAARRDLQQKFVLRKSEYAFDRLVLFTKEEGEVSWAGRTFRDYFGIDGEEAAFLFGSEHTYRTQEDEALLIEDFVAARQRNRKTF